MKRSRSAIILIIIAACFISRLPILLDPQVILDGDECVVAMMAKHTMEGKDMPLFFYGQDYGFAFIESLSMIPFFLLGVNTLAAKLAMLSLWTIGVVFFYLALSRIAKGHKWLPLLITLLLIVSPGWAAFSMKALGGYITAFTLSNIVLYLLFPGKEELSKGSYIWIGILLSIIFQAQVLWLPGLVPFVLYRLWLEKRLINVAYLLAPAIIISTAFYCYKLDLPKFSISARFNPMHVLGEYIARIPDFVFCTMHGKYALWMQGDPSVLEHIFALAMTVVVLLTPVISLVYALKNKNRWVLVASACSVGFCLVYTLFTYHIQGRYLLPLIAYSLFALFLLLDVLPFKKLAYGLVTGPLVLAALSITTFREFYYPQTDPVALKQVIRQLKDTHTRHVYCTHGMLTWQLIFYSGEEVIARPFKYPGRYEQYGVAIDRAYINGGNTAVVGYAGGSQNEYKYGDALLLGDMFIERNVRKEKMEEQFEFKEGTLYPVYK